MDETFDSVFEGNEAEESEVMDKLYDEIGIDFSSKVLVLFSYSMLSFVRLGLLRPEYRNRSKACPTPTSKLEWLLF